jgi:4-amino-4-deoxy-L-arabinose transferase-like glycosyltransferase
MRPILAWRLGVLVLVALALRLAVVLSAGPPNPAAGLGRGGFVFDEMGYLFGRKHAKLDTVWPYNLECRPPGYPLFLRALTLAGVDVPGALVVQALLSALVLVPLFVLGRGWVGERAALAACALVALYPPFVIYATVFMSETLFVFLLVTAFALLARPNASRGAMLGAGLTLAAATLTRSVIKLFVPLAVVWLLLSPWWGRGERLVRVGLLVLGLATPFALWTARNAAVYGEFIPADCQSMYNLWLGNRSAGMRFMDVALAYYPYSKSPSVREAFAREQALATIHPAPTAWAIRKLTTQLPQLVGPRHDTRQYFARQRLGYQPAWFKSAVLTFEGALWLVVATGGIAGLTLAAADPRRTLVLLLSVTVVATHLISFALARHRFPLVPFLALGAGFVLYREPPVWAPSRGRVLAAVIAVAVLLVAAFPPPHSVRQ